jgi:HEPN domain-containing protein
MEDIKFDKEKILKSWIDLSDEDYDTMIVMYDNRRYNWSLFLGHLLIEKLLKALYVKKFSDHPPYTHNLIKLTELNKLTLSNEEKVFFVTVSTYNLNARYDDYKRSFSLQCTPEYTLQWINEIKAKRLWIKKLLEQ